MQARCETGLTLSEFQGKDRPQAAWRSLVPGEKGSIDATLIILNMFTRSLNARFDCG